MRNLVPVAFIFIFFACHSKGDINESAQQVTTHDTISEEIQPVSEIEKIDTSDLERSIIQQGLVAVETIDSSILYELKYSTADNFMQEDVYGDFTRLYLQEDVARKLAKAQALLKKRDSTLSLLVYDGVRPRSIQQLMWDKVDLPESEKPKFVSNPKLGSLHNYGAAVDLTITKNGVPLDMGSPYDNADKISYPSLEEYYVAEGQLTKLQVDNRKLLRSVMYGAGFFGIQTEWWHFNSCTREEAKMKYKIVE